LRRRELFPAAFLAAALSTVLPAEAAPPRLELAPCKLPGFEGEARCGTYEVFENRAAKSGRRIALRVVVIPAREKPVLPDPLIFFEGGPGGSAIAAGPDLAAEELAETLRHRDLLLVDARGTGGSHPLRCPQPEGVQAVEEALDSFMDPAAVRRCREALAKDNDLSQYTTDAIVDDVDEVRAALGYEKVNLLGASYGTRAAMVYLRRHPASVRTVVLHSALPMDARVPLHLAAHTQASFERLAAACAAAAPCHAAFPDPRADLETVLKRLDAGPVAVPVRDREGKEQTMRLSRNGVVQTVRYLLYRPPGAREVPLLLRRAAAGDLAPLAQRAFGIARGFLLGGGPGGLYLSVTCAEDVAFIDREEAARLAAGTFVGDFRLRQQVAACAEWPAAKIPASFLEPVRSEVPVLLVSGENDPATPLEGAEKVARTLPRSRTFVVPGGAHVFHGLEGIECLDRMTADFLARGSVEGVDFDACRKAIRPLPFVTKPEEPRKP
jgi:pimeloyl-ACP methyl ester carboxylesterase